jgi:hypothetical protein
MKCKWGKYLYLSLILIVQGFNSSYAQENYSVLPWKASTTLNSYLIQEVHQQYTHRDASFNFALKSVANFEEYRLSCKSRYIEILGKLPEKTPLNPRITGVLKQEGYEIEKVVFESLPNHHITSNLYIPNGKGPFPAVLFFCGHESTAKATESYQRTAQLFVRNGFVVFMIDPISQGERYQLIDSLGKPATRGGTTEHTLLNAGSNLVGTSVAAYELWDNIRSLDYLESRPEVDRNRLGCLGNSGGGTQTTYFIAFDERIKVAAPCSYISSRERNLELFGASDGCQHIPFEGREKLEIEDFLIAFAPKPLLILAGRFDFVDFNGVKMVEKDLDKVYSLYNKPNNFRMFAYYDGHGISKPKREEAVTFFRTFFYNDSTKIVESESDILSATQLNCTSSGQVVNSFSGELTIQEYNLELADKLEKERETFLLTSEPERKSKVAEVLGFSDKKRILSSEVIKKQEFDSYDLVKLIIRSDNDIPIPCLVYYPKKIAKNSELVIVLNDEGKATVASSTEIIISHFNEGNIVVLPDLSGVGETADAPEQNDPKYWNREYRNAMISIHLGKTVTGQRVTDLVSVIQFFTTGSEYKAKSVNINANGIYGPVAIFAGLFDKSIKSIQINNSINSYYRLLENPLTKDAYSYLLPAVLKYFDILDIIKWIGAEKVTFSDIKSYKKQ